MFWATGRSTALPLTILPLPPRPTSLAEFGNYFRVKSGPSVHVSPALTLPRPRLPLHRSHPSSPASRTPRPPPSSSSRGTTGDRSAAGRKLGAGRPGNAAEPLRFSSFNLRRAGPRPGPTTASSPSIPADYCRPAGTGFLPRKANHQAGLRSGYENGAPITAHRFRVAAS